MSCPYSDCTREQLAARTSRCPQCKRRVRACEACGRFSRPFSAYCRSCGKALAVDEDDWIGFRGGPRRIGVSRHRLIPAFQRDGLELVGDYQIGGPCRALLLVDDHLVAVSENGVARVYDVLRGRQVGSAEFQAPLRGEAAYADTTLYLGGENRVEAYTVGGRYRDEVSLELRWEARLPGSPVGPLLPWGKNLYLVADVSDQRKAVVVLEGVSSGKSPVPRVLVEGSRVSQLAGNPAPVDVLYFLVEDRDGLALFDVDKPGSSAFKVRRRALHDVPRPLQEHRPIAVIGRKVFAVLGDDDVLCSLDGTRAGFDRRYRSNVRDYALSSPRKGIVLDGTGLASLVGSEGESVDHLRDVRCPPVLVDGLTVVFGLAGGQVRHHRLGNLLAFSDLLMGGRAGVEVTSLASAGAYLAAGNRAGAVRIWRLNAAN